MYATAPTPLFMNTDPHTHDLDGDLPHATVVPAHVSAIPRLGEHRRQQEAARLAYLNGHDVGERAGFVSGMHWGTAVGAIAAGLVVAILATLGSSVWPIVARWLT